MSSLFSHDAPGDESETKLFIGNLSWSVTSEELEEYLSQAGPLTWCEVKRNHNGQSKGFGLATFGDEASAANAIALFNDVEMAGRRLIVRVDSRPEDRPPRAPREPRPARDFGREGAPCDRVFCGNLPFATTQAEFEELFDGCVYARLTTDDDGQSKGYGIVAFSSVDQASNAINKFNGYKLDGRPMRCKFDARPSKSSS